MSVMDDHYFTELYESMRLHFQSPITRNHLFRRRIKNARRSTKSMTDTEVKAILGSMMEDQREHHYKTFRPYYLNLRSIVVEWIMDTCEFFDLHTTTSHAAISYLDRVQPNEKFGPFQWQMVAISCITVAAKYNEMEEDVPDLYTLGSIIDRDISYNAALDYEMWVLKQMGWKLNARTPLSFLSCYHCVGIFSSSEMAAFKDGAEFKELSAMIVKHASVLANLCILNIKFKAYPASLVSAAILYLSRKNVGMENHWCAELSDLTNSDPMSFLHIVGELEDAASDILTRLHSLTLQRQARVAEHLSSSQIIPVVVTAGGEREQIRVDTKMTPVQTKCEKSKLSPDSVIDMR